MIKDILALLIFGESTSPLDLRKALQRQSIKTRQVQSCTEAKQFIERGVRPDIIFSDTSVEDGTWADILSMVRKEPTSAEVVVVSRLPSTKLYMEVMENGGFDLIAPPFTQADLECIVESATVDVSKRWRFQSRALAASA